MVNKFVYCVIASDYPGITLLLRNTKQFNHLSHILLQNNPLVPSYISAND